MNIYNASYWKANNELFETQYKTWSSEVKRSQSELKEIESELSKYQTLSNDMHLLNKMLPSIQYDNGITEAFNLTPELFNLLKASTTLQWIKDASKAIKLTEFQKDNLELTGHFDFGFKQKTIGVKANLETKIEQTKSNIRTYQNYITVLEGRIEDTLSHFRKIVRQGFDKTSNLYNVEGFDVKMTVDSLIKSYKGGNNE